jgi:hypothetical protein
MLCGKYANGYHANTVDKAAHYIPPGWGDWYCMQWCIVVTGIVLICNGILWWLVLYAMVFCGVEYLEYVMQSTLIRLCIAFHAGLSPTLCDYVALAMCHDGRSHHNGLRCWCMVHGAWCMVHGAWRMAHGAWRMVPFVCLLFGT